MAIMDYYDGSEASVYFEEPDPVGNNYGQAFRMGGSAKIITFAKFRLIANIGGGADSITLAAKLYVCTGTPGIDGMQTGSALATSDPIEYTDDTDPSWVEFTFSTPYSLAANEDYCIVVECVAWTEEILAMAVTSYDDTSPTHGGNRCYNIGGTPGFNAGEDHNFYVYTDWAGAVFGVASPRKVNGVSIDTIGKITGV